MRIGCAGGQQCGSARHIECVAVPVEHGAGRTRGPDHRIPFPGFRQLYKAEPDFWALTAMYACAQSVHEKLASEADAQNRLTAPQRILDLTGFPGQERIASVFIHAIGRPITTSASTS